MASASDREQLKRQYPSKGWAAKVDKMRDDEISAIILRLKSNGKLK